MRDINEIKGERIAVHCPTEAEYLAIVKILPNKNGWHTPIFDIYNNDVCIAYYGDTFGCATSGFYSNKGYTIIPASEFLSDTDKPTKPALNLSDKSQNWCVGRCDEVVSFLNEKYSTYFDGSTCFYGRSKGSTYCERIAFTTEYTQSEFLAALAEYNARVEQVAAPEKWEPKPGDMVEVSVDGVDWKERIFVAYFPNTTICVDGSRKEESNFRNGLHFGVTNWAHMRKPVVIKITIDGVEKTPNDFTPEQWAQLRNN